MVRQVIGSGKFWMIVWVVVFITMIVWAVLTMMFWPGSVKNINALSIVANVGMGAAGLQSTLAMRKADRGDKF